MLILSGILLLAACVLIANYTVMMGRCQQQLAHVDGEVRAELDAKTKVSLELDSLLSKRLLDGKPVREAIDQWQQSRAELLSTGRTDRPWNWGHDELKSWARERTRGLEESVRRRFCIGFVLATLVLVLVTGTTTGVGYHFFARSRPPLDDFAIGALSEQLPAAAAEVSTLPNVEASSRN
ncbi:MAG: hypothetical protein AB7O38_21195 [Pirellulaceae bacterium]